jgi:clan AA aspartic protease (TIGR02281 family)
MRRLIIAALLITTAVGMLERGASSAPAPRWTAEVVHAHVVALRFENGSYFVPVTIHGLTRDFMLDSGCADISVSIEMFHSFSPLPLIEASGQYLTSSGAMYTKGRFHASITVGGITFDHVDMSVAPDGAPTLLGMSYLSRLKSWSIDNVAQQLTMERR